MSTRFFFRVNIIVWVLIEIECFLFAIYVNSVFLPNRHLLAQSWGLKHQNSVWNLFKVNKKDIRTASMTSFWYIVLLLWQISLAGLVFGWGLINQDYLRGNVSECFLIYSGELWLGPIQKLLCGVICSELTIKTPEPRQWC